jgi:hypothetical protein
MRAAFSGRFAKGFRSRSPHAAQVARKLILGKAVRRIIFVTENCPGGAVPVFIEGRDFTLESAHYGSL